MQFLGRSIEWKISIYASVKSDKYDPELTPTARPTATDGHEDITN
jgi:hypothetical protein